MPSVLFCKVGCIQYLSGRKLGTPTLSLMTFSIMTVSITIRKCYIQHKDTQDNDIHCLCQVSILLSVAIQYMMLNVVMLCVILNVIMQSVIMRNIVMLKNDS